MKKSFSGIKGSVATIASSPTRQTDARSKARGHVLRSQQESPRPGHDRIPVMEENRRQRPHVEHDVEEQVLLTAVRSAGQPGKDLLGNDQVAVAGDRQELGDALHHAENQRFNPFPCQSLVAWLRRAGIAFTR